MPKNRLSAPEAQETLRRYGARMCAETGSRPERERWRVRRQTYAPGETVLSADARVMGLGLVVQGQIAVYPTQRRATRPLVVLTPGRTFGQAAQAAFPIDASLKAVTLCEIWFLDTVTGHGPAVASQRRKRTAGRLGRWARTPALLIVLAVALAMLPSGGRAAVAVLPMGLGEWCHHQAHNWCAEQAWKGAAELAPADAGPRLALGVLYHEQGDSGAAERAFDGALELAPGSPEAYNNLGVLYYERGDYERAVSAFRLALLAGPGTAVAELNLGDSLLANHAYEEALVHYRSAGGFEKLEAGTLANMAIAYFQAGRLPEADAAARRAVQLGPDLAEAYPVLAVVALEEQRAEEALQALRRAEELGADRLGLDYFLGRTWLALGQVEQAESSFQRALSETSDERVRDEIEVLLASIEQRAHKFPYEEENR